MGLLVLVVAFLLLPAVPASAHAVVVTSSPAAGQVVARAPGQVWLQFNEPVSAVAGGLRVIDAEGRRVDEGSSASNDSDTLSVGLADGLGDGTYVVDYRVVSADGHPVAGAIVFGVGDGTEIDPGAADSLADADRPAQIAAGIARFLGYVGALGAAGMAVFLAFLHDGARDRRRILPWVRAGTIVGAVGALATVATQAVLVTGGGWTTAFDPEALRRALGDGMGWGTALLLGGLVLAHLGAHLRHRIASQGFAFYGALAVAVSLAFWGHASTGEPRWLALVSDIAHGGAALVWFGCLAALAITLATRRPGHPHHTVLASPSEAIRPPHTPEPEGGPASTAGIVARFSEVGAVSVVLLLVAGTALATTQVGSFSQLTTTTYGLVLSSKVILVLGILAVAAYNRWRLVPDVVLAELSPPGEANPEDAAPDEEPPTAGTAQARDGAEGAWKMLARTVRVEALAIVVVLAITSALVAITPANTADVGGQVALLSAPLADVGTISVTVAPADVGTNVVHLQFSDDVGRPLETVRSAEVQLRLPEQDIGPLTTPATRAGPGHYIADGVQIPSAGTWELLTVARTGEFDEARASFPLEIS